MLRQPRIQLRPASGNDLDAAYDLFAEVQTIHADAEPEFFKQPHKDDTFRRFFDATLKDSEQHLIFACRDGNPIGYIQIFMGVRPENLYQPERRFAYIHQLAVTKAFRKTGCGTQLIEHVKDQAREQGIKLLGTDFWSFNDAARGCFNKMGFMVNQEFMWVRL